MEQTCQSVSLVPWRTTVSELHARLAAPPRHLAVHALSSVRIVVDDDVAAVECLHLSEGVLWRAAEMDKDWWRLKVWCLAPGQDARDEETTRLALHTSTLYAPWRTYDFLPGPAKSTGGEDDVDSAFFDFREAASVALTDNEVACLSAIPGVTVSSIACLGSVLLDIRGEWEGQPFVISTHGSELMIALVVEFAKPMVLRHDLEWPQPTVHQVAQTAADMLREAIAGVHPVR